MAHAWLYCLLSFCHVCTYSSSSRETWLQDVRNRSNESVCALFLDFQAQWLRRLFALEEDLGVDPSTNLKD